MTQRQLAEAVGVAKNTIARIEYRKRNPSPALLDRLIDVLGYDVADALVTPEGRLLYDPPKRRRPVVVVRKKSEKHAIGA